MTSVSRSARVNAELGRIRGYQLCSAWSPGTCSLRKRNESKAERSDQSDIDRRPQSEDKQRRIPDTKIMMGVRLYSRMREVRLGM